MYIEEFDDCKITTFDDAKDAFDYIQKANQTENTGELWLNDERLSFGLGNNYAYKEDIIDFYKSLDMNVPEITNNRTFCYFIDSELLLRYLEFLENVDGGLFVEQFKD